MTTRPSQLPEWATVGPSVRQEPDVARKNSGWEGGDVPPEKEVNWFWNLVYQWIQHAATSGGSVYTDLAEAIGDVATDDVVTIWEDDGDLGAGRLHTQAVGSAPGKSAANRRGGIDCAGDLVVYAPGDDVDPIGILRDLSDIGSAGVTYTRTTTPGEMMALQTDGEITVGVYESTGPIYYVECWNATSGASIFQKSFGANDIYDIAIGPDHIYVVTTRTAAVGDIAANQQLQALNRSTGAVVWGYQHDSNNVALHAVCTNGRQVFVAGDAAPNATLTNANMRAIRASDGFDAAGDGGNGTDDEGLTWDKLIGEVFGAIRQLACGHGRVFTTHSDAAGAQVIAHGQATGAEDWTYVHPLASGSAYEGKQVCVDQDYVIVGFTDDSAAPTPGEINAFDPRDGTVIWRAFDQLGPSPVGCHRLCTDGSAVFAMSEGNAEVYRFTRGNVGYRARKSATDELDRLGRLIMQPTERRS